ncbi:MAG: DnaJ domain-containing protein [Candidatus Sumerlaeia bacterium]|nr:DnaJ domain-containing protein [Candidatus Sumerlaeia bacterium]
MATLKEPAPGPIMAKDDYYRILGVDRNVPEREIKRAYYALARDLHPDKAKTPEEARTNAERLATISKAYNVLKDPRKRAEYDSGNRPTGPSAGPTAPKPAPPPNGGGATPPVATAPSSPPPSGSNEASTPKVVNSSDVASQRVLTAQKAFVKGMEYFKQADYKKALPFFEAAVKNDPDSEPQYHVKLAASLVKTKGSFSRAVQAAERACELDAYNMDFKLGLGEIYETVGVTSKARAVYEDVLNWDADNEKAKMRLKLMGISPDKKGKAGTAKKQEGGSFLAKILPSIFGDK